MEEVEIYIEDCKNKVIAENSSVIASKKHYMSHHSIEWKYESHGKLFISTDIWTRSKETSSRSELAFSCYLYCEEVTGEKIRFEFILDKQVYQYFDVILNFKGWKQVSLTYNYKFMIGEQKEYYDSFSIKYLGEKTGKLYLDGLKFHTRENPITLHARMCAQIPAMNKHTRRGITTQENGANMFKVYPVFPMPKTISKKYIEAFKIICSRYDELVHEIDGAQFEEYVDLNNLEQRYAQWHLQKLDTYINGVLVTQQNVAVYVKLLKAIVIYYKRHGDKEYRKRYILMHKFLMECNPYFLNWYGGRGFASSMYLMKDVLEEEGILEESIQFLKDAYFFSRVYQVSSSGQVVTGRHEDSDDIGTNLPSLLMCVLLMKDSVEKLRDMNSLVWYIEKFCLGITPGLGGGYKADGSSFHHGGYIKQYEIVANYTMARMFYLLHNTEFALGKEAIERFRYILNTEFLFYNGPFESYCLCQYGYGFKHIKSNEIKEFGCQASVMEFAYFAKAILDEQMAGMYMGMANGLTLEKQSKHYKEFLEKGISPIYNIDAHKTLTQCGCAIHRRKDYAVMVRSYSKYVYAMEVWAETNMGNSRYSAFALYRNFGFMELLHRPESDQGTNNGMRFDQAFDFRRWSGTTVPIVPLKQIKSVTNIIEGEHAEWLFSDQGFVGGLDSLDLNGVFAACIQGPEKYGLESHFANKSYHFFEDYIVCLGSNIRNSIEGVETETILFQDYGKGSIKEGNILLDNRSHGYYVLKPKKVKHYSQEVQSRDIMDRHDMVGERTFAVIPHGICPEDESYAYIVKMDTNLEEMKNIDFEQNFKVLQQDEEGHIIEYGNRRNYVLFEKKYNMTYGAIKSVTEKCILTETTIDKHTINIGICDPDLHLYLAEHDNYDLYHNFVDQSVYGRSWFDNDSIKTRKWLVLNCEIDGLQVLKGNAKIIQNGQGQAIIEFICKNGFTNEVCVKNKMFEES